MYSIIGKLMHGNRNITGIYKNFVRTTDTNGVDRLYKIVQNKAELLRASKNTVENIADGNSNIIRYRREIHYPIHNRTYTYSSLERDYKNGKKVSSYFEKESNKQIPERLNIRDNDVTNLNEYAKRSNFDQYDGESISVWKTQQRPTHGIESAKTKGYYIGGIEFEQHGAPSTLQYNFLEFNPEIISKYDQWL